MEAIKTFVNNAYKAPGEERESYTSENTSGDAHSEVAESKTSSAKSVTPATTSSTSATKQTSTVANNQGDTFDREIVAEAPVVHERVHKTIIDENQTVVDREHEQDHYKKKIQPIAVKEGEAVEHTAGKNVHEERKLDNSAKENTRAKLAAEDSKLQSTLDTDVKHESVQKADIVNEKTHHHLHERVQPVLEKDVYQKEVRHNQKNVHEVVQDKDKIEETEVLPTVEKSEVLAKAETKQK